MSMAVITTDEKARAVIEELDALDAYDAETKRIREDRKLGRETILASIRMLREDVRQMRLDEQEAT